MGDWLHASGERIRAASDPAERERLLVLHRQREKVYDAVFFEFWERWSPGQVDAPESPQDAQEPNLCCSSPPLTDEAFAAAIQHARDEYYAAYPVQEKTLYEEITGEPLEIGVARAVAEMQAAKGVVKSC